MHLLIIEDDASVSQMYHWLFEDGRHHELTLCADGRTASAAFRKRQPDLILCDGQLPDGFGWEVIKRLQRTAKRLQRTMPPVVAVVGDDSPENRQRWLQAGVTHVHRKPFDTFDLLTTISQLTGAPGPGDPPPHSPRGGTK